MNIRNLVDVIEAGGLGSHCNPDKGPCGRRPKSSKTRKINADAMLKEAQDLYGDASEFRMLMSREIRDAYPGKEIKGWGELTLGQRRVIAQRCHAKAQDRARVKKMKAEQTENIADYSRAKRRDNSTWGSLRH